MQLAIEKNSIDDVKYFIGNSNLDEKDEAGATPLIKGISNEILIEYKLITYF